MTMRLARAVITLLLSALALGAGAGISQAATASPPTATSAPGGRIGIRLLQVPASEASDPRAQVSIIDHLAPGTVIHREFEVANMGGTAVHLLIYPAAATISQGSFQVAAGHTQDQMTTWVSVSQPSVNLAPYTDAILTATIAVPRDAPAGSQYGVIWAEEDTPGAGNITLASRIGIRIYLSVGAGGAPPSDFTLGTPVTGRTSGGSPFVKVPVSNTGGLAVDVHGTVQLANGPGGVQAGPFTATSVDTLAPGQSSPETFVLSSHLPNGPWQATFTFVSGLLTKTETATINFNGAPAAVTHTTFPVIPVAGGLAAAAVLAGVILLLARTRRYGARSRPAHP